MRLNLRLSAALCVSFVLVLSAQGWAQSATTATIAGTVRDATGAVLPGVTVEASSPALIEKIRSTTADGQGNYKILELRPGIYTVTYMLPGFSSVRREGLELTTGFTANVSVEMKVGAVEETVTVTGASPVVDVQNVRQQTVLPREVWESLPIGKTLASYVSLTLGAVGGAPDVGGTRGDKAGGSSFTYHGAGSNDSQVTVDGMRTNAPTRAGTGPWTRTTVNNQLAFEEQTIGSGVSAEQENPGLLINMVPRDGSNVFGGTFALNGSGPKLQGDNLTQELKDRGVPVQGKVVKLYDAGGGFGGPIKRDRLWFFASERWWNAKNVIPGSFYNATPQPVYGVAIPVYTPDVSRPGVNAAPNHNSNLRTTWQVNNAHKVSAFLELQSGCNCFYSASATRAPDASQNLTAPYGSKNILQTTWTYVKGSRWLFSAGNSSLFSNQKAGGEKNFADDALPLRDLTTSFLWNAKADDPQLANNPAECCTPYADGKIPAVGYAHDQRYSATYSTGSHTFKVGARTSEHGNKNGSTSYPMTPFGPVVVHVRGGVCLTPGCTPPPPVPAAILLLVNPQGPASADVNRGGVHVLQTALYAQEQWTLDRLTMNLGVRYDGMRGRFREYTTVANNYVGSIDFPAVENSPNWNDIVPRIGAAFDLFGNGKTAVKGSWGKFVTNQTQAGVQPADQLGFGGGVRTWNDTNRNFFPDCSLTNPLANGECGQLPNVNRGLPTAPSTFYDDAYLVGWHVRPYQWSSTLSVQHQLRPGFGVSVGYFRTTSGNFILTDNRAVVPSDFDQYCVTAPTDPRLGSVSGSRLCGFTNVKPAKFGQTNNLVTTAKELGVEPVDQYNGVDISVNARFGRGGVLSGGVSTGQNLTDNCYTIDAPPREGYCRNVSDWAQGTQVKLFGNYPLPWWGVQVSATFQNLPGPGFSATRTYTSAEVASSLGRPLAAGATSTASISLRPQDDPNLGYEPRYSETDLRISKTFLLGRLRAQGQFDMYNLFNANPVLGTVASYTTAIAVWPRVSSILGARLLKFGMQLDWK